MSCRVFAPGYCPLGLVAHRRLANSNTRVCVGSRGDNNAKMVSYDMAANFVRRSIGAVSNGSRRRRVSGWGCAWGRLGPIKSWQRLELGGPGACAIGGVWARE